MPFWRMTPPRSEKTPLNPTPPNPPPFLILALGVFNQDIRFLRTPPPIGQQVCRVRHVVCAPVESHFLQPQYIPPQSSNSVVKQPHLCQLSAGPPTFKDSWIPFHIPSQQQDASNKNKKLQFVC